ncbi:magnesium transporter [Permianibacter aggregans]|uniref:Magnesium transporter MgtE n=1 Tax=Permianibacter aggregans TaxID=1510150 RepID=A0A4R6UI43_9GAMM|nr:magnesium transporter [Permianibacter aggregans]QGX40664.1 magnesium transporter [Permianibacter aggregans]TDQ46538.1 magnesium transporter [Permianibacter aggregans]
MVEAAAPDIVPSPLTRLQSALARGMFVHARRLLTELPAADVAHLMSSVPPRTRELVWKLIDSSREGDILQHLDDDIRAVFLGRMAPQELAAATRSLDTDDVADLLADLPDDLYREVLRSMDEQNRARVLKALAYPEDTAGGLMNTDTVTVRPDVTVDVVLRYLRLRGELPEATDTLFVVDRDDQFVGTVALSTLVTSQPEELIEDLIEFDVLRIPVDMKDTEVAQLFERRDLVSAPVIDEEGVLIGRITIDDVVDVIREEADSSLKSMGGLDEHEETFGPVLQSARRRTIWLGINMVTALVAALVNNAFEGTLEQLATVAVLLLVVPSMGGAAGNQAVTLTIRGIALGHIEKSNYRWLIGKEIAIGMINGLIMAALLLVVIGLWKSWLLGGVISGALLATMIAANLAGVGIPLLLRHFNLDPALAGNMLLTTVTDIVGLMTFLGLTTLILL